MDLYQEEILEHYKHPRNKKRMEHATASAQQANPVCGDKLGLGVEIKNGIIEDIGFWGEGCAISQAAMSMLTEKVAGEPVEELKKLTSENVLDMLGVPVGPGRIKCALLCLSIVDLLNKNIEQKA